MGIPLAASYRFPLLFLTVFCEILHETILFVVGLSFVDDYELGCY